jgi:bisphosphoglycerate-dependent phosphoglycerate mutase
MTYKLGLLRRGESVWNKANLSTGWTDVPLSDKGVKEANRRIYPKLQHMSFGSEFASANAVSEIMYNYCVYLTSGDRQVSPRQMIRSNKLRLPLYRRYGSLTNSLEE